VSDLINADKPCPARVYDWFLGGKDNFEVDRAAGRAVMEVEPDAPLVAVQNRKFLDRTVRFAAGQGVRQFLDLGSGLPTAHNTHQIAQGVEPRSRVVYVDNDPIVLAHGRALLSADANTTVITADLRAPQRLLSDPHLAGFIDFTEPVAVLLVAVLHFVPDADDPDGIIAALRARMAPGSYLILSHVAADAVPAATIARAQAAYRPGTSQLVFRARDRIGEFLDGLDVVDPGLVPVRDWRPDGPQGKATTVEIVGAVARTPGGRP
jgi:O-methyltransferase involved in polyketide biosynthesis